MTLRGGGNNYPELVTHVLRDAQTPLTLDEVVQGVQKLAPIHAANPRALIENIMEHSSLILPVEEGRFGYLPFLLMGNAFRQPLPPLAEEHNFVELSPDAMTALWPGWTEGSRQQEVRPAQLSLPNGVQAELRRHFELPGHWGLRAGAEFWQWLTSVGADPGDDLIIRVIDAENRAYEGDLERRDRRDERAIAARNRQVGDQAVLAIKRAGGEVLIDHLAPMLIAAGSYREPPPPDPLVTVLAEDGRFIDAGLGSVALLEGWSGADERLADLRQQMMWDVLGAVRSRFRRASPEPSSQDKEPSPFARLILEGRIEEAVNWLQRENRIHTDEEGQLTLDLQGLLDNLPDMDRGGAGS